MRRPALLTLLLILVASTGRAQESPDVYLGDRMPFAAFDRLPADRLLVPGGEIMVAVAPGALEVPRAALLAWNQQSASAVAGYYGRFPAPRTRLLVVPGSGRSVSSGRSWGYRGASVRIIIGAQATPADLARDWILVHELTHLAFPSVPSRHHWIEEGLASYVEPVARAQAGQLAKEAVWAELAAGLPKGLPQPGDRGLDHTPTWGRTYWGGALFALLADVEIHGARRTAPGSRTRSRDPRHRQHGDVLAARAAARHRRPGHRRAGARRAVRADEGPARARRPGRAVARAGRRGRWPARAPRRRRPARRRPPCDHRASANPRAVNHRPASPRLITRRRR